jgi:hypothetical protein
VCERPSPLFICLFPSGQNFPLLFCWLCYLGWLVILNQPQNHRCEDASGLTFDEWDPSADTDASQAPVAMIVNSSELRATGVDLREVIPLQLEAV